ncbi:MAG: hypothetical protein AABY54_04640 [Deltaproteobacteria bacterium]
MKIRTRIPVKIVYPIIIGGILSGCGGMTKPDPKFDPSQSAASQAVQFIDARNTKNNKNLDKIAITSCNVLVGEMTSASAETGVGAFAPSSESKGRVDAKVSSFYYLRGISDEQLQQLAEDLCLQAEQGIKASGRAIVPASELASNEHFLKMHEGGKDSPFEFTPPGSKAKYKVLAPKGQKVFNPAYVGTGKALSMAFSQASGNSPLMHEGRLIDSLKADAAHVDIMVDFARLEGSSDGMQKHASRDTASVKGEVRLAVRGQVMFVANESMKCWKAPFSGKQECMTNGKNPEFLLKYPIIAQKDFVKEIKDETSTGDKVAGGITQAVGMMAAMGGGRGSSASITRTGVVVDPVQYTALTKNAFGHFLEMAMESSK